MKIGEKSDDFILLYGKDSSCITVTHLVSISHQAILAAAQAEIITLAPSKCLKHFWQILNRQIENEEKYAVPKNA